MIDLAAWEDAQAEHLDQLRDLGAEGSVLQQLLETSCLLELSKIASAQPELVLFVQSTVEVIAQFFTIDGCRLEVHPPGLPTVSAAFGLLVGVGTAFPLRDQGEVIGQLVASEIPDILGGSQFFGRIAEQVAHGLASVAEVERLRRRAAAATAARLAAGLDDWRDEQWLEELCSAVAVLPNALGACLTVEGPTAGGPIVVSAGVDGSGAVDDRREIVGTVGLRLAVSWDRPPDDGHRATIDAVWRDLVGAVGRAEEHRRLQEQAETDELTGVGNRRRAVRTLAATLRRAERRGEPVAVLMLDLDHFKSVNDELGHATGDEVLRAFAALLVREVHDGGVARMGGEEFLVVLPNVDVLGARLAADRLRAMVPDACGRALPEGRRQTVSIGISGYPDNAGFPDALIREADRALYEAKRSGRDQVAVAAAAGSDHPVRL